MKTTLLTILFVGLSLIADAQMKLTGRFLYTQNNEKVIPRGVNEMFIYAADKSGWNTYPEIKKSGANMIRITWNTTGPVSDLKNSIYNCVTRGTAIPVVTVNDATCDFSKLQTCVNFWLKADVKAAMMDFKKWTILNIANEAGDGNVTKATYLSSYKSAITQLRNAGYTIPIMIDASGCGQNIQMLKDTWSELLNYDPLKKIIFSAHTYWTDGGNSKFLDMVNYAKNNNMPFIFGEGPQQKAWDCNTNIDYKYVMQICQTNEIGWLAWSWGVVKNGDCQAARSHDITTNGVYGSWVSQWSQDIVFYNAYSIQKTSVRPASLTASNPFARVAATDYESVDTQDEAYFYPNPAKSKATISLPNDDNAQVQIEVVSMLGTVVSQKSYTVQSCDRTLEIDLENIKGGNYIIKSTRGNRVASTKVVIEQ